MPNMSVTPCDTSVSTNASDGVILTLPWVTRRSTFALRLAVLFAAFAMSVDFLDGLLAMGISLLLNCKEVCAAANSAALANAKKRIPMFHFLRVSAKCA